MRKRSAVFILIGLMLFIFLYGCTEQLKEFGIDLNQTKETVEKLIEETTNETAEPAEINNKTNVTAPRIGIDYSDEVEDLLYLRDNEEYTAEYTTILVKGSTIVKGKEVVYSKPDYYRFDVVTEDEEAIISTYILPEGNYVCSDILGKAECSRMSQIETQTVFFEDLDQYEVVSLPSRTVSNKTGLCYLLSLGNIRIEQCFLNTGVPLYLHITDPENGAEGIEFTQSLTDVVYEVDDKKFELIVEVE